MERTFFSKWSFFRMIISMAAISFNRRQKNISNKTNIWTVTTVFTWNSIFSNDCRHFFPFFSFHYFFCHIVFAFLQTTNESRKSMNSKVRTVMFCNLWLRINQSLAIFLCQTFCQQHTDVVPCGKRKSLLWKLDKHLVKVFAEQMRFHRKFDPDQFRFLRSFGK